MFIIHGWYLYKKLVAFEKININYVAFTIIALHLLLIIWQGIYLIADWNGAMTRSRPSHYTYLCDVFLLYKHKWTLNLEKFGCNHCSFYSPFGGSFPYLLSSEDRLLHWQWGFLIDCRAATINPHYFANDALYRQY